MSSNSISVGPGLPGQGPRNVGFPQQGQVDWVSFGNTVYQASLATMQRLAAAGVQPITHGAGLALATQFKLGNLGRRRISDAIAQLQSVPAFGQIIYFGFGVRNFVHLLAETQVGLNCIALCASLAEMHTENMAASVVAELWQLAEFPQEYQPSLSQFRLLVKACSGVLTRSSFPQTADVMMGDMRQYWRSKEFNIHASPAADIARALDGLFRISRGTVESITVTGGAECAFIAAVAQWLFNFTTHVEDGDGNVIFTSGNNGVRAQVEVRYAGHNESTIQLTSTTYSLGTQDFSTLHHPSDNELCLTYRIPWDVALSRVFGPTFASLIKIPVHLGDFLGSAARILAALAKGEPDVAYFERDRFVDFAEVSYGQGFLDSAVDIFPELGRVPNLPQVMSNARHQTFNDALKCLEKTLESLQHLCKCPICDWNTEAVSKPGSDHSCLVSMALTIQRLIETLACVIQDFPMLPTVRGLEEVYTERRNDWMQCRLPSKDPTLLSRSRDIIQVGKVLVMESGNFPAFRVNRMVLNAARIFISNGRLRDLFSTRTESDNCTALSRSGVCVYLEALRSPSAQPERLRRVHVLPGHIQRDSQRYDDVWDPSSLSLKKQSNLEDAQFQAVGEMPQTQVWEPHNPQLSLKALVTEISFSPKVQFYYQVSTSSGARSLSPGNLTEIVLIGSGMVICDAHTCKNELVFPCNLATQGWHVSNEVSATLQTQSATACCLWSGLDELSRCVVISHNNRRESAITQYLGHENNFFIKRHECWSCCTEVVLRESGKRQEWDDRSLQRVIHII
jgi:hypothetical protein